MWINFPPGVRGNAGRFGFMRVIQENFIFDRFRFIAFQESVCLFAR